MSLRRWKRFTKWELSITMRLTRTFSLQSTAIRKQSMRLAPF